MSGEPCFPNPRHQEAALFSNPLLRQLLLTEDSQSCTALLQEALPLVEMIPLEPEASWWLYGANLQLGSLIATAWTARPVRMAFSERQEHIVVLGYGGEHRQRQGRDSFDELIDYIKQNLGESLTLTDLESRSHYSRRALQYGFAERMGCTVTKWIKMQRLDRARQRLERPNLNDTVGSIARECGYRSLGLFSVDFQQRFHVKPSQLLRESRPD